MVIGNQSAIVHAFFFNLKSFKLLQFSRLLHCIIIQCFFFCLLEVLFLFPLFTFSPNIISWYDVATTTHHQYKNSIIFMYIIPRKTVEALKRRIFITSLVHVWKDDGRRLSFSSSESSAIVPD